LNSKYITIGAVIIVSIITFITLLGDTYIILQGINPIALLGAIAVAVIGITWFKKANN
jgi:hypothetical protein